MHPPPVIAREKPATDVLGPGRMGTCCPPGWRHPWSQGRRSQPRELKHFSGKLWNTETGWTWSREAMLVPGFQGVTAAKIRGSGKGWKSCRAEGKRIKQQLAGSAREGLAQPSPDLLSLLWNWGRAVGGAPSAHHLVSPYGVSAAPVLLLCTSLHPPAHG